MFPHFSQGSRLRASLALRENQRNLDPTTRLVRRYELYNYTGTYDPITHEHDSANRRRSMPRSPGSGNESRQERLQFFELAIAGGW